MAEQSFDSLKLENQLCFPLYAASREIIRSYRPFLDRLDLTYTQYIAMMVLWEHRVISVRELGKKLFLDSGTLTPVLKAMEKKGFIRRYRCTEDERVVMAELTEKGEQLKEAAAAVPEQVAGCYSLEPADAAQLYRLLYKLLGTSE